MHEYHKENWRRGTTLEKSNTAFEDDDARLCAKDVDTADELIMIALLGVRLLQHHKTHVSGMVTHVWRTPGVL